MSRMDRYNDSNRVKRSEKNHELYQDISKNPKYTNIAEVANLNAYEIGGQNNNRKSRESYQKMKNYLGEESTPRVKKELEDFKFLYQTQEKKSYDINTVLEEARKNRMEKDELDEKRKLKYTSYNILAGVNLEELIKYREEKKKRNMTPEEEGIRELVDTIASKTLAGELDKETTVDLLSDLMATNMLDKVSPPDEIENDKADQTIEKLELTMKSTDETTSDSQEEKSDDLKEEIKKLEALNENEYTNEESKEIDNSFYTKSMDLSDEDFEMATDFKEKGLPTPVKVLITLLIIIVIAAAAYFIYLRVK